MDPNSQRKMSQTASKKVSKREAHVNVDRILLGTLTKDREFLQGILGNQRLNTKKKNMYGEKVRDLWQDEVYIVSSNVQREG